MSAQQEVRVPDELASDPNSIAYQSALKAGQFQDMQAGTYVFFHDGKLAGTGMDRDKLLKELKGKGIDTGFFHQVNEESPKLDIPTPFEDRD